MAKRVKAALYDPSVLDIPTAQKKVDPLAHLPWRMFSSYAGEKEEFIIAKNKETAVVKFKQRKGLTPEEMVDGLLWAGIRIGLTDGGHPNPQTGHYQFDVPLQALVLSPFRLFRFNLNKTMKDSCGNETARFYVIGVTSHDAQVRVLNYGQGAVCMCEMLSLPRYFIQTADGRAP